ncbi:MAG: hypothetical protein HY727_12095 [Candidatus Rokubacteria bacterium]|nr:hypothetical protein [Candidatus Rokubacteria bacterium]
MRKSATVVVAGLLMAFTAAGQAAAADCREKIDLAPTSAGVATDTSGKAEVRARGSRQRFKVSMDSRVADGTTYLVFANGLPAGTITIALGDGELELDSKYKGLPEGVDPVCGITTVDITDATGLVVLQGNF